MAALTHAQLVARIQAGDTLNLMGVPPGSGMRMGIDRNEDGVLDGDVPQPKLEIEMVNGAAAIHWPLSAAGFTPETSDGLASNSWTGATNPVEISGGDNYITNPISGSARFYRLRFPAP
jgi:hypothetical protein